MDLDDLDFEKLWDGDTDMAFSLVECGVNIFDMLEMYRDGNNITLMPLMMHIINAREDDNFELFMDLILKNQR